MTTPRVTEIIPGVTVVQGNAITTHTRVLDDGRFVGYADTGVMHGPSFELSIDEGRSTPGLPRYAYFAQDDMFVIVTHAPEQHEVQVIHPLYGETSVHEDALTEASDADIRALPPIVQSTGQGRGRGGLRTGYCPTSGL